MADARHAGAFRTATRPLMYNMGQDVFRTEIGSPILPMPYSDEENDGPSLFLSTHPASEERVEALEVLAEKTAKGKSAQDIGRARFLEAVLPHRALFLKDEFGGSLHFGDHGDNQVSSAAGRSGG